MPNKTIYVSDDDLPLYQRAQELAGGNLSSAIARALRRFVAGERDREAGFGDIEVHVGPAGVRSRKRFRGRRLVRWQYRASGGTEIFSVYQTVHGRLAVHVRRNATATDWSDPSLYEQGSWADPDRLREWYHHNMSTGEVTLDVYDSPAAMREQVPAELADLVDGALSTPAVEELDI